MKISSSVKGDGARAGALSKLSFTFPSSGTDAPLGTMNERTRPLVGISASAS